MDKPTFEVFHGRTGAEWYWHLIATNGEIIAASEGYSTEDSAQRGVETVKRGVLAALGINPRKRILLGTVDIREIEGGDKDGELETTSSPAGHYVEVDPDVELPL